MWYTTGVSKEEAMQGEPRSAGSYRLHEQELPELCRAGDREAWDIIVPSYRVRVCRFAEHLGCTPDDAQDLAQQTMMRAWEKRLTYKTDYPFLSWLFAIARNLWIDRHHKKTLDTESLEASADQDGHSLGDKIQDPDSDFEQRLMDRAYLECILRELEHKATALQYAAFRLRELEEMDFKEVAATLGIGIPAAHERYKRAREKLALIIAEKRCD
jgi:RNA polymerase sigma-70 factor, ECF subfamily